MTPKEQYEARKAERKRIAEIDGQIEERTKDVAMLDMMDRFVTAIERIADTLEKQEQNHDARGNGR